MDIEKLNIFSKDRTKIGVASRVEVHKKGYWHEAFHCWFISKVDEVNYLNLQLRSKTKKENPSLSFWGITFWLLIILVGFDIYKKLSSFDNLKNLVKISNYIMLFLVALTAAIFYTTSSMP
jgi:hypothetical protein